MKYLACLVATITLPDTPIKSTIKTLKNFFIVSFLILSVITSTTLAHATIGSYITSISNTAKNPGGYQTGQFDFIEPMVLALSPSYSASVVIEEPLRSDLSSGSFKLSMLDISANALDIPFSIADALLALRSATGIKLNNYEMARLDVAPYVAGKSVPDGKVDITDVLVILNKVTGNIKN